MLTRLGRGCDNARMRGTGRSILSIGSAGSILSAFSRGSLLAWRGDRQRPARRLDAAPPPEIAAPEQDQSPGRPAAGTG